MLTVVGMMLVFGLVWQMLTEPVIIGSVILAQNMLLFSVARFANRNQYHSLKNWVVGWWIFSSVWLALWFVITAALMLLFWWWAGMSVLFLGTELIFFSLAHYLADHPSS
ncbi:MAG: hypothetical protein OEX81_05025 [Candidatus Pacebacteria bacterium]|nr:hypothetical protein [Candidatus Paceibacterota bacterium]